MKLFVLAALVGCAAALAVPNTLPKNFRSHRKALMKVEHTKLPEGVETIPLFVNADIPDSFDARAAWPACPNIGYIRDQSDCGSCWAFAATEALSDRICIASQGAKQPFLSADDLLSCCGLSCGFGCEGGYPIRAWNYFVKNGVCTGNGYYENEGCKPYPIEPCGTHTVDGETHYHNCTDIPDPATPQCIKSCTNNAYTTPYDQDKSFAKSAYAVPKNVNAIKTEIFNNGPVEAAFTVYEDFDAYTGGIYQHTWGQVLGGHAVKILGWGSDAGTPYWLVANSWDYDWGEDGFFRIIQGTNECGIEEAIVAGLPKV